MTHDYPDFDINTIDFEDNPVFADPDGHYFDREDMYIDRDESYMIANIHADYNRKSNKNHYSGGSLSSFWNLKKVLIALAIFWIFGTFCRIALFLIAFIMAI